MSKMIVRTVLFVAVVAIGSANAVTVDEVVKNASGIVQFTIKKDHITIPNLGRDQMIPDVTKHIKLEFALRGSYAKSLIKTEEAKGKWGLVLNDETTAELTTKYLRGIQEYSFRWPGPKNLDDLDPDREVCFYLGKDVSWYNTFQQMNQRWPMDLTKSFERFPLNAIQNNSAAEFQFVVEHLFLSSAGFAIVLDRETPLWFRIDPNSFNPLMCISSNPSAPYDTTSKEAHYTDIKFSIFAGRNIRDIYEVVSNQLEDAADDSTGIIVKPKNIPEQHVFAYPSWLIMSGRSIQFVTEHDYTQEKVIEFVRKLKSKKYLHGVIALEHWWQEDLHYLEFNKSRIHDAKKMVEAIHKQDHLLSLVVRPYVSVASKDFQDHKQFFVHNAAGSKEKVFNNFALIDFSNAQARAWFTTKLQKLKTDTGVDSFIFERITILDADYHFARHDMQRVPVLFTEEYVRIAEKFGSLASVYDGHRTQDLSVFVRMAPRMASWTEDRGIKSLIPTALALSMAGYSFFIPDLIGGREGNKADEELYLRWVQACTYMPAMQFTTPPWDFPNKEDVVNDFVNMHSEHAPHFMDLARKRAKDGTPVIRPMWWVDPDDEALYKIANQYMVGDDLLVAPVLDPNTEEREVYLPKGKWMDHYKKIHEGPLTVTVKAPIDVLPHFKKHIE